MARLAAAVSIFPLLAFGSAAAVAVAAAEDPPAEPVPPVTVTLPSATVTVDRLAGGQTAAYWRRQDHNARAQIRRLKRVLATNGSVREAIGLACTAYGHCADLWRKARCETGGTFSARAYNPGSQASGLFQFLPSTWASTPYGRFSVWSAYANALAAGWMHAHGRGGEWACR